MAQDGLTGVGSGDGLQHAPPACLVGLVVDDLCIRLCQRSRPVKDFLWRSPLRRDGSMEDGPVGDYHELVWSDPLPIDDRLLEVLHTESLFAVEVVDLDEVSLRFL